MPRLIIHKMIIIFLAGLKFSSLSLVANQAHISILKRDTFSIFSISPQETIFTDYKTKASTALINYDFILIITNRLFIPYKI